MPMKTLNLESTCMILKLGEKHTSNQPLVEQLQGKIGFCKNLLLDISKVELNSMLIGELVNVYQAFESQWKDHQHKIGLVNASTFSGNVLNTVKLTEKLPLYATVEDFLKACSAD